MLAYWEELMSIILFVVVFIFIYLLVEIISLVVCFAWLCKVTRRVQEQEKIITKLIIALDKTNKKLETDETD